MSMFAQNWCCSLLGYWNRLLCGLTRSLCCWCLLWARLGLISKVANFEVPSCGIITNSMSMLHAQRNKLQVTHTFHLQQSPKTNPNICVAATQLHILLECPHVLNLWQVSARKLSKHKHQGYFLRLHDHRIFHTTVRAALTMTSKLIFMCEIDEVDL